jgi:hypothetical protein
VLFQHPQFLSLPALPAITAQFQPTQLIHYSIMQLQQIAYKISLTKRKLTCQLASHAQPIRVVQAASVYQGAVVATAMGNNATSTLIALLTCTASRTRIMHMENA